MNGKRVQLVLDKIDLFQRTIPSFNMRGRTSIASWVGSLLSLLIFCIILIYAALKMVQLLSRANPNVSSYIEQNFFDSSDVINFKEKGIRFAFGIEGFLDKELKQDERYVKKIMRLVGKKDGLPYERIMPYHKCTEADFEEFAPPQPEAEGMLKSMKTSKTRGLFCLDWD